MQKQPPSQSPPLNLTPSMTPFKKRLLHRVEDPKFEEKEDEEYTLEKQERIDTENKNPSYEEEEEYPRGVDQVRGERNCTNEHDEMKTEEDDLSEDNFNDEHGLDHDGYRKERHDVVRERQKQKELEVFVGGLDRETTEIDLREVFSEIGDITEVRLLMNPMTNKNKGFAFIRFATVEQARRALNDFKRPMINGKQCGVAPSQDSDTLFVGNICKSWSKDMLKEKLVRYGIDKFEDLTLLEDAKNEGMNRGFAFLDFNSRADALEASRLLQKRDVIFGTDRTARVAFADTFVEPDDEIMAQVRTVFVDGLPPSWEEEIIKDHLRQFGKIEKVELARNMPAAKRDDFGFITFNTHESAVSCVDGINDSEIVFRNKKVKVRARLSRPRQRGKSIKYARGGYSVGTDSYGGYRSSWVPRRKSYDSRGYDDVSVSDRSNKRPYSSSTDRSLKRRSPVYERSSFKPEYTRQQLHRDYIEESSRTVSRVHRNSHIYDEDEDGGRYMYLDHSSRYNNDGGTRNFSSSSGLKRPYSSIEEHHPRYNESSRRHSRADFDYANNSELVYNDRIYGSEPTRVTRGSRSGYSGSNERSAGYRRGHDSEDPEEMYSRYGRVRVSRDYISSRSEMRAESYSPTYSNQRVTNGYVSNRVSDSYY